MISLNKSAMRTWKANWTKPGWMNAGWMKAGLACAAIAAAGVVCTPALADEKGEAKPGMKEGVPMTGATLKVGDKAPGLAIAKWVKGEPVTGFEKGRIYVVEFWATWCGPCRATIPHLTELAHKHKKDGVTMIGISSSDRNEEVVEKFVKQMGDKMDYVVAIDQIRDKAEGKKGGPITHAAYMQASGQQGIPAAFVVDRDGKIAWIGHPADYLEYVIEDMVAGTFDPAAQQRLEADSQKLMGELDELAKDGDWDEAMEKAAAYSKLHRSHAKEADGIRYGILLNQKKDYKAAYELGNTLVDTTFKSDAQRLNEIAWRIVDDEGIEERDYKLALKAAKRANELTKGEDPMILDTLAKVYFDSGDKSEGIKLQQKAVEMCKDEKMKKELQETLERYKQK